MKLTSNCYQFVAHYGHTTLGDLKYVQKKTFEMTIHINRKLNSVFL